MTTYLCIAKATGRLAGTWGPSERQPPAENETHVFIDRARYPDMTPYDTLDLATGVLTKGVAPARLARLSKFEFMKLLTEQEFLAIDTAAESDPQLRYGLRMLDLAIYVEPARPLVTQMLDRIVSLGIMTAQRRQAFMAAAIAKAT